MPRTFYGRRREEEVPEGVQQEGTMPQASIAYEDNQQPDPLRTDVTVGQVAPGIDVAMVQQAQQVIGEDEIAEAVNILQKYKQGKAKLEKRLKDDELWWELRHWEAIRDKSSQEISPKSTSAWLFNSLTNKHADAMDNYPEPLVLPRERDDEASAKLLTSVLPVVLEYNDFDRTYDLNWWEKLKHGTGAYGIFWDSKKENGLGDIDIKIIDLLKLYWQPGITDIQKSRNIFITELMDVDILDQMYPEHAGKMKGGNIDVAEYLYDEEIDTSDKAVVVDWYYKITDENGRTIVHYCKFCNKEVLYSSENDPKYADRGMYDHGMYPVILDVMYPEKGTPIGFGDIAVCRDPQIYIDQLSTNILESAMMGTRKRFFVSANSAINKTQFLDWNEPFVDVEGELGEERIREIMIQPISPVYMNILDQKINEMKETAANRDVNSGGNANLTAAAAISAIQEAGNKQSRANINVSYRCFGDICKMIIELMRQFYDETRAFRIIGESEAQYQFVELSNAMIRDQVTGKDSMGNLLYRKPIFDIKVKAQKRNPFSTMEANQRAQELYQMGFFNPERAQETIPALEMMEFEGIDKVREYVKQGQTLMNIVRQQGEIIAALTGQGVPMGGGAPPQQQPQGSNTVGASVQRARTPMTSYGQRLAARSTPSIDATSNAARPR